MKVILVGAGVMAFDYYQVLKNLEADIDVVGRGVVSASVFKEKTGLMPFTGGLENYLASKRPSSGTVAIIATGTEFLLQSLMLLMEAGVERIMVEKPAAISIEELLKNEQQLKPFSDKVFVAYNRRFYQSVENVKRLISEDGGAKTMHFEFTEWSHLITDADILPEVKKNWFFANSTHVIDLAFFIGGPPAEMACFSKSGNLTWHEKTNFSGAGITQKGVVFSYVSNWESAGRWAVEIMTDKRRFLLKPMEGILVQMKGSVAIEPLEFNNEIDVQFKPGLYFQTKAFLDNEDSLLLSLGSHITNTREIYAKIIA
jgi:predicted dehydrogenase